jgi:WD40 repeat protein
MRHFRQTQTTLVVASVVGLMTLTSFVDAHRHPQESKQQSDSGPRLVVQTGHAGAVDAVALSPDGTVAVTGSADGSACLWEIKSGREIRCLSKQEAGVAHVDYSSDGRMILTALEQKGIVRLWNPRTGEKLRQFAEEGPNNTLQFALFSPDARYVLTGGSFNTVILWDVTTGQVVRRLTPDEEVVKRDIKENPNPFSWPMSGAFSIDGRLIAVGGNNGIAHIWEVESGKYLKAMPVLPAPVHAIAFSPDSKMLLVGGSDAGSEQRVVGAVLWNLETGKLERIFKHDQVVTALAFTPDGRMIMTSSDGAADRGEGYVRLWDPASGAQLRAIKPVIEAAAGHICVLSRDGRFVLMSEFRGASLWDVGTGKLAQQFAPYSEPVGNVRFTPDGKFLAIKGASVSLWSLDQGREVWRDFMGGRGYTLSFAPDGKTLVAGSGNYDTASGEKIGEEKFATKETYAYISDVSPDGRFVVTASAIKGGDTLDAVTIWDAVTGQPLRRLAGHAGKRLNTIRFSQDSKRILTSGKDFTARLWDVETGRELLQIKIESGQYDPFEDTIAALSPDGQMVLTAHDLNRTVKLWSASTGQQLSEFKGDISYIKSAVFAPDGKTIATGDSEGTTLLWETLTGKILHRLTGHVGSINAVAFSPDGRLFVTGGQDGTTRLWRTDTASDQELCRLQSFDIVLGTTADKGDHGWVVAAPDGRFDSNTLFDIRGMHWLLADDPLKPLPLEVFLRDYYEPRLLARLYLSEPLRPLPDLSQLNRVQPTVTIKDIKPEAITTPDTISDQVTVIVEVASATGAQTNAAGQMLKLESGVFDVRLFRDGQLVGQAPDGDGAVKLDASGKAQFTFAHVRLSLRGLKKVEFAAYAFNKDRVKSSTDRRIYDIPGNFKWERGRAYVISVGVNGYERDALNLRYAANDARQIQDVVTRLLRDRGAFQVVPVPLVSDYEVHLPDGRVVAAQDATSSELKTGKKVFTINQATKENVRAVLDALAGKTVDADKLKTIPNADQLRAARPDDMVLLTFSSHGYADANGVFYVVPSNTGMDKLLSAEFLSHCISSDELSQWLRDVDAGEMAMIVDACHSAAAVAGTDFKPGPMGSRGLGQLAYDKGMRILTATQTDNVALETNQIRQGLLSYALIQNGLKEEKANYLPHDEKITLAEWLNYAVVRVPELYAEMRAGRIGKELTEELSGATNEKLQQPSLFDFSRRHRDVLLVNNF